MSIPTMIIAALTAAAKKNPGPEHDALVADIRKVRDAVLTTVHHAEDLDFHDYATERFATPKTELIDQLEKIVALAGLMIDRVKIGVYDNADPLESAAPPEKVV